MQRRQEDRAYQLQLIQVLSNAIKPTTPSTLFQQMFNNPLTSTENVVPLPISTEKTIRAEKRAASPPTENKRNKLPTNFYSLLAQIHNINDLQETD